MLMYCTKIYTVKENTHDQLSTWKLVAPHETEKKLINLGFVNPCIIIHSNKSTNQMHQSLRFIARRLNTA
jgi:hypothetical protein